MTKSNKKQDLSKVLLSNAQMNQVVFNHHNYVPTSVGHGIFVKTQGDDIVFDLRLARQRPFIGHSHPLLIQHQFKNLHLEPIANHYSIPKSEIVEMVATFQRVHFIDALSSSFKIDYHNVVIYFDECLLDFEFTFIQDYFRKLVMENPDTYFWFIEEDISLLAPTLWFYFEDFTPLQNLHLCLNFHFISSVFIRSHHLFSDDENIHFFLGLENYIKNVVFHPDAQKNKRDYEIMDSLIQDFSDSGLLKRTGRYLTINKVIDDSQLNDNGILTTQRSAASTKTVLCIPLSCTETELTDLFNRLKRCV